MPGKISELPAASQANDADQMEANQAGTSRRVTRAQVIAGLSADDHTHTITNVTGLQTALDAKAPTANPVFTGTVTIPDGALAIADVNGLQTALNAKLTTTALATGAITPRADDLDFSGGADGMVWTIQADGSAAFESPTAATVNVDQHDVVARVAAGNGAAGGLASGDLTEEPTPAAGDFLLGWESGTALRKFDVGDLPFLATASPTTVTAAVTLGTAGSISDNGPISASGALTKAVHGGRVVLTTGNVTIPNAAGDVGMGGMIKADASRTVSFNSTSLTLAVGDVLTYYVQSTTELIRSKRLAADQPAMA